MKHLALAALLAFGATLAAPATTLAQGRSATTPISIPVTGSGSGSTFAGTLQLQNFATQNGQLVATGLLTGIVTNATGTATSIVRTVALPAAVTDPSCGILHLDLGPLSLNLLGLQVNLNEIVLDITAQSGAGNLLGNLLCSVTNLLNDPNALAKVLNNILAAL